MKYLLDTNIISEVRKGERGNGHVMEWWESSSVNSLFLSVLTLAEIQQGIFKIQRRNMGQANHLKSWLWGLNRIFANRLVSIDQKVAMLWADIRNERTLPMVDSLLAASALAHDMTFVTRNTKDIRDCGVKYLNPFES